MGIFRNMSSKIKSIESIVEELRSTGIAKDTIETYDFLNEVVSKDIKKVNKVNERLNKETRKLEKANYKVMRIAKRIEQIKGKSGFLAFILPFGKMGKEYRILKKQLKIEKTKRKFAEKAIQQLKAQLKVPNKRLKYSLKRLNAKGKEIRSLWNQNKYQMKLVNEFDYNRNKLEKIYDQESVVAIGYCVQALRQNGDLPLGMDAKSLCQEISKAKRSRTKNLQEFSVVRLAKEKGTSVKNLLEIKDKKKEKKPRVIEEIEQEEMPKEMEEEEQEVIIEENIPKVEEQEEMVEDNPEKEEYEMTATEIPEATGVEDEEIEREEKEDSSNVQSNEFKETLQENTIFANSTIDRKRIEEMQKNQNSKILRAMTPEEFIAYVGYVQTQKNGEQPVKYEEFLEKMNGKTDEAKMYAKRAIKSLEKMTVDKSEEEIGKMSEGDKFLYGIAEDYKNVVEEEGMNKEEQAQMETR